MSIDIAFIIEYQCHMFQKISKLGLATIISTGIFLLVLLTAFIPNPNQVGPNIGAGLLLIPLGFLFFILSVVWLFTIPKPRKWWQYVIIGSPLLINFILPIFSNIYIGDISTFESAIRRSQSSYILDTVGNLFYFVYPTLVISMIYFTEIKKEVSNQKLSEIS